MKRTLRTPRESFFTESDEEDTWGDPEEKETKRRIMVAVAAYAYEIKNNPIWSDAKFDRECLRINLKQKTGNRRMDKWFKANFDPSTGMWVVNHPNRKGLLRIYRMFKPKKRKKK